MCLIFIKFLSVFGCSDLIKKFVILILLRFKLDLFVFFAIFYDIYVSHFQRPSWYFLFEYSRGVNNQLW